MYVSLDDLAVDVKLYKDDIQKQFDTLYAMSAIEAVPNDRQQPSWQMAQAVTLRVSGYDKERKRFLFALAALDERTTACMTPELSNPPTLVARHQRLRTAQHA